MCSMVKLAGQQWAFNVLMTRVTVSLRTRLIYRDRIGFINVANGLLAKTAELFRPMLVIAFKLEMFCTSLSGLRSGYVITRLHEFNFAAILVVLKNRKWNLNFYYDIVSKGTKIT